MKKETACLEIRVFNNDRLEGTDFPLRNAPKAIGYYSPLYMNQETSQILIYMNHVKKNYHLTIFRPTSNWTPRPSAASWTTRRPTTTPPPPPPRTTRPPPPRTTQAPSNPFKFPSFPNFPSKARLLKISDFLLRTPSQI